MKPGTTLSACAALIRRDLTLVWRRRGDALNPIRFALIVVALFPLALGPEPDNLRRIAAGTVFVGQLGPVHAWLKNEYCPGTEAGAVHGAGAGLKLVGSPAFSASGALSMCSKVPQTQSSPNWCGPLVRCMMCMPTKPRVALKQNACPL